MPYLQNPCVQKEANPIFGHFFSQPPQPRPEYNKSIQPPLTARSVSGPRSH